jgi:hypothetical protein
MNWTLIKMPLMYVNYACRRLMNHEMTSQEQNKEGWSTNNTLDLHLTDALFESRP